ncbi:MAG: LemA family protein [Gemmatimonadetes bacterium]|nr:LemA family protein [Gemmatimonadota bacterium]
MRISRLTLALALGASLSGCGYNQIQALDERANEAKSNIGVELTNRNQLIPNLVATVKGAANFESSTYTGIARERSGSGQQGAAPAAPAGAPAAQVQQAQAQLQQAQQQVQNAVKTGNPGQMAAADAAVTRQIGTYINVAVEAYPQLRATQNFTALQDQLAESENRISVARRDYNTAVREYNTYIRTFPQAITARVTGAQRKEPYEAPAGSEAAPNVDFSKP